MLRVTVVTIIVSLLSVIILVPVGKCDLTVVLEHKENFTIYTNTWEHPVGLVGSEVGYNLSSGVLFVSWKVTENPLLLPPIVWLLTRTQRNHFSQIIGGPSPFYGYILKTIAWEGNFSYIVPHNGTYCVVLHNGNWGALDLLGPTLNVETYDAILTVPSSPPIANFSWSPLIPKVGELVTFDASLSTSTGGTITEYEWNFGDGLTASGLIATHTYASATVYNVTLNITDSQGLSGIAQKQLQVVQPHGPKAEFTVVPEIANVNQMIEFDASASQSGWNGTDQMPITEYRWNFGDSDKTTTITATVLHAFNASGIYYPTLTVYAKGSTPETDTITHEVTILSVPVGGYAVSFRGNITAFPSFLCFTILMMFCAVFTAIKRKRRQYS